MTCRWWTEREQASMDRARKSSEEILALRGQAEETKKDLQKAINRRDVAETARLMSLSAAFDAILASARPVKLSVSDVRVRLGVPPRT